MGGCRMALVRVELVICLHRHEVDVMRCNELCG